MGFTDLLFRLSTGKLLSSSYYDEEFVVASISKFRKIISNADHFNCVNLSSVDRMSVAVSSNSIFISNNPSGVQNSSNLIGRDFSISSLASFNLKILPLFSLVLLSQSKFAITHISEQKNAPRGVYP